MQFKFVPYPLTSRNGAIPSTPWNQRVKKFLVSRKWHRTPDEDLTHHVDGLDALRDIKDSEIVVITRERNGYRYVRSFLRHYRALGADRFVFIDEASTDGTPELLAEQKDVIFLPARTDFVTSVRGRRWVDVVLVHLAKGQRVIVVDNDEYLVFSDGTKNLSDLFAVMAQKKMTRLCTIMLDLYPPAPVRDAVFDGSSNQLPWEVATLFDTSGYDLANTWQGPRLIGGVRRRLFGETLYLTKYAAMFNPARPIFDLTAHFPQPLTANTGPVAGALLHFKYFSDFIEEHQRVVERGVHNKGGKAYRAVLEKLDGIDVGTGFDFAGPPTVAYRDPKQLCELGLITDICG